MYIFGSGVMTVTPILSSGLATPINIGLLQDGSVDFTSTVKTLYGQYRDPIALGAGTRKWTGKAKVARFSARIMNNLLFGGSLVAGQVTTSYTAGTVPASSTYTIGTGGSYASDQGVVYAATGIPLTRVTTPAAVGQYGINAGTYTFFSGDASAAVVLAYNYSMTVGQSILIPQTLIGPTLNFSLNFTATDPSTSSIFTGQFYYCVAEKFGIHTKLEDFSMPEFDFMLAANAAGNVGQFNLPDTH
jgi:hypothetical protein